MDPVTFLIIMAVMIGAQLLMAALTPASKPIDHIQVNSSAFGEAIPFVDGDMRIAGKLAWLGILRSTVSKNKKIKTTNYFESAHYVLSEPGNLLQGISRIWFDGIVVYDVRPGAIPVNTYPSMGIEVHTGAEDQEPSIIMEAEDGVGNVPSYRGVVSITLKDIPLHKTGYRLPVINFEQEGGGASTPAAAPIHKPLTEGTADPSFFARFDAYVSQVQRMYNYNENMIYVAHPPSGYSQSAWELWKIDGITGDAVATTVLPSYYGTSTNAAFAINEGIQAGACAWASGYLYLFNSSGTNMTTTKILKFNKSDLSLVHTYSLTNNGYPQTGGTGACNISGTLYAKCGGVSDNCNFPGQPATGHFIHVINGNTYSLHNADTETGGGFGLTCCVFDANDRLYVAASTGIFVYSVDSSALLTLLTSRMGIAGSFNKMMTYDVTTNQIMLAELVGSDTVIHFLTPGTLVDAAPNVTLSGYNVFSTPWDGNWSKDATWAEVKNTGSLPGADNNNFYLVNAIVGSVEVVDYGGTWPGWAYYAFVDNPGPFYDELSGTIAVPIDPQNQVTFTLDQTDIELAIFKLPGLITLQQHTENVLRSIGLSSADYDMSEGASTRVRGAVCIDRQPARNYLGLLQPAYFFDIIEHDWQLVLRMRAGVTSVINIPEEDVLNQGNTPPHFDFTDPNTLEVPPWIDLSFFDADRDFQTGNTTVRLPQASYRSTNTGTTIQLPVVLTADEGATAGQRILDATWAERQQIGFFLSQKYLLVEPADVVNLIRKGATYTGKIGEGNISSSFMMAFKAGSYNPQVYDPARKVKASSGTWFKSQVPLPWSTPLFVALDTALLRAQDDHPGMYVQSQPVDNVHQIDVCDVYKSPDSVTFTDTDVTTAGFAVNCLPNFGGSTIPIPLTYPYTTFDNETILYVWVYAGAFTTHTQDELLADPTLNLVQWGDELLQFNSAVQVSVGYWKLTGFYRGSNGTEWAIGLQDSSSALNVVDKNTSSDFQYGAWEISGTYYYQSRDISHSLNGAVATVVQECRRLKPYAPVYPTGTRDGGLNLTCVFQYRSRMPGQAFWTPPVFGTDLLAFQADIYNGVTVVRTLTLTDDGTGSMIDVTTDPTQPRVIYTATAQTADFGSAQASVHMKVYQLNSIRGRGYPGDFTV